MTPCSRWLTMALLLAAQTTRADEAPAPLPGWMAGSWCLTTATQRIEEVWLAPAGGLMLGMSRTVATPARRQEFEFLRIELQEGVPTYLAQPQGRAAVAFRRVEGGERSVRFQNLAHDFPKRIDYRRDGERLHAEIAGPGRDGNERVIGYDYVACGLNEGAR